MNIRGVDIEVEGKPAAETMAQAVVVETGDPTAANAAGTPGGPVVLSVTTAGADGPPDERSVRTACAGCLARADGLRLSSIAMPPLGCRAGGLSPVASGKIMVQEVIRYARNGGGALRSIMFCRGEAGVFEDFEKAVTGYVRHFLDVLIWGPFVTVDAIIEVQAAAGGSKASSGIVVVKRSNPPFGYALPGGFVDYGESLEEAVRREAREETGLELLNLRQFHTYSDPGRDPRFHTVTTVFSARAEGMPRAGDDAAEVAVFMPEEILSLGFAFDHARVLREYRESTGRD
jgi:ADP-ribose pyrophosphatase YjhB (NUDIX family)/O-acetyl-ADP-ribose deacetylase (regulator of RNase III)